LLKKQLSDKYKIRRKGRLLGSQDRKLPKDSRKGKETPLQMEEKGIACKT